MAGPEGIFVQKEISKPATAPTTPMTPPPQDMALQESQSR